MPLSPGADRATISKNISEMVSSGHPQRQAVAAALHNADQYKPRRADGGGLNIGDMGSTIGGMFGVRPVTPSGGMAWDGGGLNIGDMGNTIGSMFGVGNRPDGSVPGLSSYGMAGLGQGLGPWSPSQGMAGFGQGYRPFEENLQQSLRAQMSRPQLPQQPSPGPNPYQYPQQSSPLQQPTAPINHMAPLPPAPSSMTPAGPTNQTTMRADGGSVPWYARNEARSMLHTGPIKSPVSGRTDHIPLKVPGGSYVLPADHISHLGQNNTDAGMARAAHMFGGSGPFGSALPKVTHGRGTPHAPPVSRPSLNPGMKPGAIFRYGGTAEGSYQGGVPEGDGDGGVDIMAAGGEYVIHPDIVREIGGGKLNHGHQVLDEWVLRTRKKHKQTLAGLPAPAK